MKVLASLIFSMMLISQAQAATFKIATITPDGNSWMVAMRKAGKDIEKATEGRVKVKMEYGLGHPKTMFELVEDGVADASWSYHGYVPGRFKLTSIVEQPMLGVSAEAASVAHWRIHQKYLAQGGEHEGVILAALFTHGPGQIQMAKPIASLSELKGKKISVTGAAGSIGSEISRQLSGYSIKHLVLIDQAQSLTANVGPPLFRLGKRKIAFTDRSENHFEKQASLVDYFIQEGAKEWSLPYQHRKVAAPIALFNQQQLFPQIQRENLGH